MRRGQVYRGCLGLTADKKMKLTVKFTEMQALGAGGGVQALPITRIERLSA